MLINNSTDNTKDAITKWHNNSENCTIIVEEKQGVSSARNTGIRNAHGKLLILIDYDFIW